MAEIKKVPYIKQSDPKLDRFVFEMTRAVNELLDKVSPPASSSPKDISKKGIQATSLRENLYTVDVKAEEGFIRALPGIFQKVTAKKDVATEGQVPLARGDGNYLPGDLEGGTGITITYEGGVITIQNSGVAGTGITTLNALTALIQLFATGTTGSDFNISSSGSTHTFHLPTASASVRGALSTTDWSTFNNKTTHRCADEALVANTPKAVSYSSALSTTPKVGILSCVDGDGASVECTISSITTTGFTALCPVNATLNYLAIEEK